MDQLHWYFKDPKESKDVNAIAPSWSWVSYPGHVQRLDLGVERNLIVSELISAQITRYPPETPLQQMVTLQQQLSYLVSFTIRGHMKACQPAPILSPETFEAWMLLPKGIPASMAADVQLACDSYSSDDAVELEKAADLDYYQRSKNCMYRPDVRVGTRQELVCFLLARTLSAHKITDHCLVSERIGSGNRVYERVGYFTETIFQERPFQWRKENRNTTSELSAGKTAEERSAQDADTQNRKSEDTFDALLLGSIYEGHTIEQEDIPGLTEGFLFFRELGTETEVEIV